MKGKIIGKEKRTCILLHHLQIMDGSDNIAEKAQKHVLQCIEKRQHDVVFRFPKRYFISGVILMTLDEYSDILKYVS